MVMPNWSIGWWSRRPKLSILKSYWKWFVDWDG